MSGDSTTAAEERRERDEQVALVVAEALARVRTAGWPGFVEARLLIHAAERAKGRAAEFAVTLWDLADEAEVRRELGLAGGGE